MEGSVEGNEVAATEEAGKDNVSADEAAKKAAATKADEVCLRVRESAHIRRVVAVALQ